MTRTFQGLTRTFQRSPVHHDVCLRLDDVRPRRSALFPVHESAKMLVLDAGILFVRLYGLFWREHLYVCIWMGVFRV